MFGVSKEDSTEFGVIMVKEVVRVIPLEETEANLYDYHKYTLDLTKINALEHYDLVNKGLQQISITALGSELIVKAPREMTGFMNFFNAWKLYHGVIVNFSFPKWTRLISWESLAFASVKV